MNPQQFQRTRIAFTALVALAELAHLAWEYTHGGVISHHLLNQPDMPAISNWWGALLLPALAWFLFGRLHHRVISRSAGMGQALHFPLNVVIGFVGALLYGISLAVAFTVGNETVASYLFIGMLLMGVLIQVYRPEYVFGYILGLTFTFGAVLPTLVASVVAAMSAIWHLLVRQIIRFIQARLRTTQHTASAGEESSA
jgi:hypothetical protein